MNNFANSYRTLNQMEPQFPSVGSQENLIKVLETIHFGIIQLCEDLFQKLYSLPCAFTDKLKIIQQKCQQAWFLLLGSAP